MILLLPRPPSLNNLFPTMGELRGKSAGYRKWLKAAANTLLAQRSRLIPGPVQITVTLPDRGMYDPDNYLKATLDCLVAYGVIEDDNRTIVRRLVVEMGDIPHLLGVEMGMRVEIVPAAGAGAGERSDTGPSGKRPKG